jgi:hypothetical protein
MFRGARIVVWPAVLALALLLVTDTVQGPGPAQAARERAFAAAVSAAAEPGDLIFISAGGTWSELARFLSRREKLYSHVGVIARGRDGLVVIHAGGNPLQSEAGVHADTVGFFMAAVTRVGVYRLPDAVREKFLAYVKNASARALPFDSEFSLATTERLYCTELVWRGLVAAMGRDPIANKPVSLGNPYVALDDVTGLSFLRPVALRLPELPPVKHAAAPLAIDSR